MTPTDRLLLRLESVKGKSPKWMAKCPAHSDSGPSLSIKSLDDGRVLIHCFAGCSAPDVMAALGMSLSDLFPEALGEFMSPNRSDENKLYRGGFLNMQREIHRLRAMLSSK